MPAPTCKWCRSDDVSAMPSLPPGSCAFPPIIAKLSSTAPADRPPPGSIYLPKTWYQDAGQDIYRPNLEPQEPRHKLAINPSCLRAGPAQEKPWAFWWTRALRVWAVILSRNRQRVGVWPGAGTRVGYSHGCTCGPRTRGMNLVWEANPSASQASVSSSV